MNDLSFASPYKIAHHPEKLKQLKQKRIIYPIQVEIHPTLVCNHRCKRCITDAVCQRDSAQIKYERLLLLIREFALLGVKTITFSGGGEPLLYPGIHEIMHMTKKSGMGYGVITNLAAKLDRGLLRALKNAAWIRVSLDAASEKVYRIMHQAPKGDFGLVLENIKGIRRHCFCGINYLVQKENYPDIPKAASLAKKLGIDYIRFVPIYDKTLGRPYKALWKSITVLMDKARLFENKDFHIFAFRKRFEDLFYNDKSYRHCYIHELHPILGADLKIYACCNFPYVGKFFVADVSNRTFRAAWRSQERIDFINRLDPKKCPPCWYNEQNKFINFMLSDKPLHVNFV